MAGFTGLVNFVQAGISCSHYSSMSSQSSPLQFPPQDDVTMSPVSSSDAPGGAWDDLKDLAGRRHSIYPNSLGHDEQTMHRALFYRRQAEEGRRSRRNHSNRCDSLVDVVMMSPPSTDQSLPPQPAPSPYWGASPGPRLAQPQDADVETMEATGDSSAFNNVRFHPYQRPNDLAQVSAWVKKKASMRTLSSRREQATLEKQHDVPTASLEPQDQYFIQAAQFITSLCERQLEDLSRVERGAQAGFGVMKDLDKAIDELRAEIKKLKMQRRKYPANPKTLVNQLREVSLEKGFVVQRQNDILEDLQVRLMMQRPGQDFFAAWREIQVRYNLPPDLWPTGIVPPTSPCPPQPSDPTSGTAPFVNLEQAHVPAEVPAPKSDELPSSPSSSSFSPLTLPDPVVNPALRSPKLFSFEYLPSSRPRNEKDRYVRYDTCWDLLHSGHLPDEYATFGQMPWPVLFDINKDELDRLDCNSIKDFLVHRERVKRKEGNLNIRSIAGKALKLWFPDKMGNILSKFVEDDRDAILCASKKVVSHLLEIYQSNDQSL